MRRSRQIHLCGLCLILLALAGCGDSEESVLPLKAEERFKLGMAKFDNGDYVEALEDFKIVTLQFQGTKFADQAQFYMGECHYLREEFVLAAYEYDLLIRTMPSSSLIIRARYRRAMCYYNLSPNPYLDQDYTRKAIDEFQAFIEYSPTDSLVPTAELKIAELNEKLATKEYLNGMTYMHQEYYKAAISCFEYVIDKYHDTPVAEQAHFMRAQALYLRKKYRDAQTEIEDYLRRYPNSERAGDAQRLKANILDKILEMQKENPGGTQSRQNASQTIPQRMP